MKKMYPIWLDIHVILNLEKSRAWKETLSLKKNTSAETKTAAQTSIKGNKTISNKKSNVKIGNNGMNLP